MADEHPQVQQSPEEIATDAVSGWATTSAGYTRLSIEDRFRLERTIKKIVEDGNRRVYAERAEADRREQAARVAALREAADIMCVRCGGHWGPPTQTDPGKFHHWPGRGGYCEASPLYALIAAEEAAHV